MFSAPSHLTAGVSAALLGGVLLTGATSPSVESEGSSVRTFAVETNGSVSTDAIVMGDPSGASIGGWTEIGRTPVNDDGMSLSDLHDVSAVGDRLVAIGTIEATAEGPSDHVVLTSTDGLTWVPAEVPGTDPLVTDLAATSAGLLAGGSEVSHGERAGALWASRDGLAWTTVEDVPFSEVDRIVSAESPRVITDTSRRPTVWVNVADNDWTTSRRLNEFSIAHGPGGFLMWRGGGQDRATPTRLLFSADATDFTDVELPAALTNGKDALAGISIFQLEDRWVLVPSEVKLPDTIFTSTDGVTWDEAPRPTRMTEDVRWVATIGDQTQAFGHATAEEAGPTDLVPTPSALWSWSLGEAGTDPTIHDPEGDDSIDQPVAFGDGYIAVGRDGGQDAHITIWRYEPAAS